MPSVSLTAPNGKPVSDANPLPVKIIGSGGGGTIPSDELAEIKKEIDHLKLLESAMLGSETIMGQDIVFHVSNLFQIRVHATNTSECTVMIEGLTEEGFQGNMLAVIQQGGQPTPCAYTGRQIHFWQFNRHSTIRKKPFKLRGFIVFSFS